MSREAENTKTRRRRTDNALQIIDSQFRKNIKIVENGRKRRVTVIEAIVMQLVAKEARGDKRAASVRLRYQNLERTPPPNPKVVVTHERGSPVPLPKRTSVYARDDDD
jgi:hypothetical protein